MWLQGGSQVYVGKGRLRLTTREVDLLSVCVTIDTPHWCTVRVVLCCVSVSCSGESVCGCRKVDLLSVCAMKSRETV